MNPVNVIRGNKFIHEMLPTARICHSKAPKVLMQSDMPLGLRSSARSWALLSVQSRQMNFGTKAQSRPNYRSHDIEIFGDL